MFSDDAGPPNCKYLDFQSNNECWLSSECSGHDVPESNLEADALDNLGVMQGIYIGRARVCTCRVLTCSAMLCTVFCSYNDSLGMTCSGDPIATTTHEHMTSCYDTCEADPECNLFAFHSDDGGKCDHFAKCAGYVDSEHDTRVYMLGDTPRGRR
jgi:hypothetical protein